MNAIWITNVSKYKNLPVCLESAQAVLNVKNQRRELLLKKYGLFMPKIRLTGYHDNQKMMLAEGRAAQMYWKYFSELLPNWCNFRRRYPHSDDMVNRLLDIGYHQITNVVKKILEKYNISPALGILHIARKSTSAPLAYDLVEMFRADVVEVEVLRFLRMKKRSVEQLRKKDIAVFLYRINRRLDRKYYIRAFRHCHTYRYYMELQVLKFVKAVNHKEIFSHLLLPSRHDTRCTQGICFHAKPH
jgi:CRISPR-associated endonuclease Cas1